MFSLKPECSEAALPQIPWLLSSSPLGCLFSDGLGAFGPTLTYFGSFRI